MKWLQQKAMDTEQAVLSLQTCISNTLSPTKHLVYFKSKQALTFVPNGWVQHNCRAYPRDSGQEPRKPSSTCENFYVHVEIPRQRQNTILQMSQAWNCLSLCLSSSASFTLLLLTAAQPGSCYTLADAPEPGGKVGRGSHHNGHHAQAQGGQMSLVFLQLLSTLFCKLTNKVRLGGVQR